jgi:hypothetical protein
MRMIIMNGQRLMPHEGGPVYSSTSVTPCGHSTQSDPGLRPRLVNHRQRIVTRSLEFKCLGST